MPSINPSECLEEITLIVHGDFKIFRQYSNSMWKTGWVEMSWRKNMGCWLLRIFSSINKGVPDLHQYLKQNKLQQVSKAEGVSHGSFINIVFQSGTRVTLRQNGQSSMTDFNCLAQIFQEIKAGNYEKPARMSLNVSEKENMEVPGKLPPSETLPVDAGKPHFPQIISTSPRISTGPHKTKTSPVLTKSSASPANQISTTDLPRNSPQITNNHSARKTYEVQSVVKMAKNSSEHVTSPLKPQPNLEGACKLTSPSPAVPKIQTSSTNQRNLPLSPVPFEKTVSSEPDHNQMGSTNDSLVTAEIQCLKQNNTYSRLESISSSSFYSPLSKHKSNKDRYPSVKKTPSVNKVPNGMIERHTPQRAKAGRRLFDIEDEIKKADQENFAVELQKSGIANDLSVLGFPNLGNTCYINAVLQAVLSIDHFALSLQAAYERHLSSLPEKSLVRCLVSLMKAQMNGGGTAGDYKGLLTDVKNAITSVDPTFIGNHQNDAHEFLGRLLEQINEEVSQLKKGDTESTVNPISENFEFEMVNSFACKGCGETSSHKEPSRMLSADIPQQKNGCFVTLQDVLNAYFEPVNVVRTCEKCLSHEAKCLKTFEKCPRFLIIHLKRYQYSNNEAFKKCQDVVIPLTLRLDSFACDDTFSYVLPNDVTPLRRLSLVKSLQSSRKRKGDGHLQTEVTTILPKDVSDGASSATEIMYQLQAKRSNTEILTTITSNCRDSKEIAKDIPVSTPKDAKSSIDLPSGTARIDLDNQQQGGILNDDDIELQTALLNSLLDTSFESQTTCTVPECFIEEEMEFDKENAEPNASPFGYQLTGIISHVGDSIQHGHFICDLRCSDQEWIHFNDDIVSYINLKEVLRDRRKMGYIFFYKAL